MVSPQQGPCIDLHEVAKTYRGKIRALDGIDMRVSHGEIFGLLGPNGAGKSTLVKIMMTVVRPTKASGTILGQPIGHKPTLAQVGYLPEDHRFPPHLRGGQVLDYYAALSGVRRATRRKRAEELLELVGMTEWRNVPISRYSKGMMQRIGLAQALVNDPQLIVLDEPTDGVDPVGRRDIRNALVQLRDQGRTVFLNSHLLSEIEMVCDRVAILVKGQVVRHGTLDDLTRDSNRYEIEHSGPPPEWIDSVKDLCEKSRTRERTVLAMSGHDTQRIQPVLDRLRADGRLIHRVERKAESLEDLFIRSVGGSEDGAPMSVGGKKIRRRAVAGGGSP